MESVYSELGIRYEINFSETEINKDYVHFLIHTIPNVKILGVVKIIKNITSKYPEVKIFLQGGDFWAKEYYVNNSIIQF